MAVFKMTMALVGFLAPGILAITPYSGTQSTVTAEQIGSVISDGVLVYSMNYCTIVQSTECQVSLTTGALAAPESSAVAPTVVAESSIVTVSSAPGTGETVVSDETIVPGEPVPTAVVSATSVSEIAPGAPQSSELGVPVSDGQPIPTVISTTDSVGSPSLVTSTALAATGTASASGTGVEPNSTSTDEHEGSSGITTGPSAPTHTGAGAAFEALPGIVLGAAVMAMAFLI